MKITSIKPSYYFTGVVVIRTECGHFHLRPEAIVTVKEGEDWRCYCEDEQTEKEAKTP